MSKRRVRRAPRPRSEPLRVCRFTDTELRAARRLIWYALNEPERRHEIGTFDCDEALSAMVEMRRSYGGRQ